MQSHYTFHPLHRRLGDLQRPTDDGAIRVILIESSRELLTDSMHNIFIFRIVESRDDRKNVRREG